ncbi:MAG: hypothetical protein JO333_03750, partial [Verrucomicrobia bacterium]|nr:hypothetical protein [Verrucomicrobiota bacterium]
PYRADYIQVSNIVGVVLRPVDPGLTGIVADQRRVIGAGFTKYAIAQRMAVVVVLMAVDDWKLACH